MSAKVQGVYNCATLAHSCRVISIYKQLIFLIYPRRAAQAPAPVRDTHISLPRDETCHMPLATWLVRVPAQLPDGSADARVCEADGGQSFNPVEKCTRREGVRGGEGGRREAALVANQSCTLPIGCHCVLAVYDCDSDSDSNFDSQSKLINFCTHSIDSPALPCSAPTGWTIRKTLLPTLHIQHTHCNLSLFALLLAGLVPESTRQMAKT